MLQAFSKNVTWRKHGGVWMRLVNSWLPYSCHDIWEAATNSIYLVLLFFVAEKVIISRYTGVTYE